MISDSHPPWHVMARALCIAASLMLGVSGCNGSSSADDDSAGASATASGADRGGSPSSSAPDTAGSDAGPSAIPSGPPPTTGPAPLSAWFDRDFRGGDLRLGVVRERTASYTSYDVSYQSQGLRITGVLNVPRGTGPFPAAVLAHGYIDPKVYRRGQGMTRERAYLAARGYIALHVDYRNHAESYDDPKLAETFRNGYSVDVINAVHALRASKSIPVNDAKVALVGRSMGGGVIYKALEMAPGLVDAAVTFASVSSLEADNYRRYAGKDSDFWRAFTATHGTPETNPDLFAAASPRAYADRITEPLLLHHGTKDTTCPPDWARATRKAFADAGVDVTLQWYQGEGHAFVPQFDASMARTLRFLSQHLE